LKRASSPVKSQAGQRTDAKYLPHFGHLLASIGTSALQSSQKNLGLLGLFFPAFDVILAILEILLRQGA
jgi:hypothetical protein